MPVLAETRVGFGPGIWYINQYAGGPGLHGAYRAHELAHRWRNAGFDAVVVTGSFNNPPTQTEHYPPRMDVKGVPYVTVRTNRYRGNGVGRILSILSFSLKLFAIGRRVPRDLPPPRAIVISTVHPFGIFAGVRLARRYRARLVFEIRDLWPLTLTTLLGKSRLSPLVVAAAVAQRHACCHADLVASLLPRAEDYFRRMDIAIGSYVWVPNGVSVLQPSSLKCSVRGSSGWEALSRWRREGRTVLVHAGAIGPPNAIDRVIDALIAREEREADRPIAFLVIGDGVCRDALERRARRMLGDSVHFVGRLDKAEAQALIALCDIAWAGLRDVPELYRYGISLNKIPSYYDAGLPVLLPVQPCGDAVSESGGGIAAPMPTVADLLAALDELVDAGAERRRELGARGQRYVRTHYDYDRIAERYLAAMLPEAAGYTGVDGATRP